MPDVIESGGKKTTLELDQTLPLPAGEAFRNAGMIEVTEPEVSITLTNSKTKGFVIADAIQLLKSKN